MDFGARPVSKGFILALVFAWLFVALAGCGGDKPAPVSASRAAAAASESESGGTAPSEEQGTNAQVEPAMAVITQPEPEVDDDDSDDRVAVEVNKGSAKTLMDAPVVGLGEVMKTAGTVGKVSALADRGCACDDAACFSATKEDLDKLVEANSTTKFSPDEVAKVKAAVERLTGCEGKLAAPSGQAAADTNKPGSEPDLAAQAMAEGMRLVKALCGCPSGDRDCLEALIKEAQAMDKKYGDDIAYTDQQKLAQKGLETELVACMAKHEAVSNAGKATTGTPTPTAAQVDPEPEKVAAPTTPEPGVVVDDAPPQVGSHPRGQVTRWSQLPQMVGMGVLRQMGAKRGSPYIDMAWGQSMDQILAAFPGSRKLEPSDLEPNTTYIQLDLATQDGRKRNHRIMWKFLDDSLFQVTLELKRSVPNLLAIVQQWMGRPADGRSQEGWSMDVSTWTDGGLLVRAVKDGKSTNFSLAFRDRHEAYLRRGAKGREAYVANRAGLKLLSGLRYSNKYPRVEKHFLDALRIAPHYGHARVNLCRLYFYWGHFSHASRACQEARNSRTNSVHAEAAYYSGLLNVVQGYRANGLKWLRMVKSYSADSKKPTYSANRHLRVINGRGKKKDFKQAYKEVVCAWVAGDRRRSNNFAKSYGYSSARTLGQAAYRYGVNIAKLDKWATKRCR